MGFDEDRDMLRYTRDALRLDKIYFSSPDPKAPHLGTQSTTNMFSDKPEGPNPE
jgi:hypothetical protein